MFQQQLAANIAALEESANHAQATDCWRQRQEQLACKARQATIKLGAKQEANEGCQRGRKGLVLAAEQHHATPQRINQSQRCESNTR
eukprot:3676888-Amphidinium_carterae.2